MAIERMAIRPVPGYQAVVDHLRREFILGRIRPGERLPAERQLAEHLGVARETLRQALRVLEGGGHVVITRGARGGAIVQESFLDRRAILAQVEDQATDILDLTELRSIIESAAAELAAVRRDDGDLETLEAAHRDLETADSLLDSRHADTRFHLAIAAAARNTQLVTAIEDARVRMFATVDLLSFTFVKHNSVEGHERVLAAIRAGDGPAAAAAMRDHLAVTREEFHRLLSTGTPGSDD